MNGSSTGDPCARDGGCLAAPAEFVRLRYFFGQRLGVVDLADEQAYVVGKQHFHNARAHGAGVLCGLRAERYVFPMGAPAGTATTLLRVRRGAALDGCGREIVVGWDQCIDVAAWRAQHPDPTAGSGPLRLWVALRYRECPSDPAPAPRDPCGCDAGGCEMARVREGFELTLLTDADAAACITGLNLPGGGGEGGGSGSGGGARGGGPSGSGADTGAVMPQEVLDGSVGEALARAVARLGANDCPDLRADSCLLLAVFNAAIDGAGRVTDVGVPDNAPAQRRTLLSTEELQRGLIQIFAAAGEAEMIDTGPRLGRVSWTGAAGGAGTLAIAVELRGGAELAQDPLGPSQTQLTITVTRFKDDGSWAAQPPASTTYVTSGGSRRLELAFSGGLVDGGRYRLTIENDATQPAVDTQMRPLSPRHFARHFRLVDNGSGVLALAGSLYP